MCAPTPFGRVFSHVKVNDGHATAYICARHEVSVALRGLALPWPRWTEAASIWTVRLIFTIFTT